MKADAREDVWFEIRRIATFGISFLRLQSSEIAEDATQNAMLQLMVLEKKGRPIADLRRMAAKVARNQALMLVRGEKNRQVAFLEASSSRELIDNNESHVAGQRFHSILERARREFSGLRLRIAEEWLGRQGTAAQIAALMHTATPRVAWHLSAIRKTIRKWVELMH